MVFLSLGRSDRGTPSDYSRAYWNGFQDHIRVIPWNIQSTSREEPLNISLGESSRSIFIQLRGFYVFELIPLLIKITSNLDDSSTSLPSFPYDLNLKLLDIITIPNMVQKVLTASYLVVFVFH